tara:strand:- start:28 stop:435 length:408 start_codon:yes stop_codon:yes gene_type:complete
MKISSLRKRKKKKAIRLDRVEKLLKGTRLKVKFLKGQYYLGTVTVSSVKMQPYFKVTFDDGDKEVFPYPVSRQIQIISDPDLSKKSPINYTSIVESDDSFNLTKINYSQIRIGKKYQATIPKYLGEHPDNTTKKL